MVYYFKNTLKNWSNFSGRTSRAEFWWSILAHFLCIFAAAIISTVLVTSILLVPSIPEKLRVTISAIIAFGVNSIQLVLLVPMLAVTVRRFHDVGKSGWMYLVCNITGFCCFIGVILYFYYLCQPGDPNPNAYGNPPNQNFNNQSINNYQQPVNNYQQQYNNYQQPVNNYQQPVNNGYQQQNNNNTYL